MTRTSIDIKGGRLFPFHFLIMGAVLFIAAVLVVIDHPIIAGSLFVLSITILTAYEGTEINETSRTLREYYAFLFVKTGNARKYSGLREITVRPATITQKMYSRTNRSASFTHQEFHVYLMTADGEKIFLFSSKSKDKARKRAADLSSKLRVNLNDRP